jgi:flagellar protein FlbD
MIKVTKLNGELFYVNPYEIEFIEETPDTVISLKSGKKVLVAEKADTVIHRMIEFYRLTNVMPKLSKDRDLDVGFEADDE